MADVSIRKMKHLKISVNGIVQGVGFRPFVFNLANKLGLKGYVTNQRNGVLIELEGERTDDFLYELKTSPPSLSEIEKIEVEQLPLNGFTKFEIIKSETELGNKTFISPDVSICNDCLNELLDPANRRYYYPFINCTNCGPRFTIIENIPYDRPLTTMKVFPMCDECKSEYEDPSNRRFHAQPNACPECGPQIELVYSNEIVKDNYTALELSVKLLSEGKIGAIKGLGGFHLACDAYNEKAVKLLRDRKHRDAKPFAVMVRDIDAVKQLANISEKEIAILTSKERPILLLKSKPVLPGVINPDNTRIGIMLPYTPLHYIIFDLMKKLKGEEWNALIMTSANMSEEPICIDNIEAGNKLNGIADFYLHHNRKILIRADDSVGCVIAGKYRIFRRSRGYVPKRIKIISGSPRLLGVGAELKNTICVTKDDNAFLSQHIGDLTNLKANEFFEETIEHLPKIMDIQPEFIVRDLHPDYISSQRAERFGKPVIKVQHHHAHMAACMMENKLDEDVIGVVLDGTGLGYDNTIWGGEIFAGNYTQLKRVLSLEEFLLPGGDSAAKEPWRCGIAYLYQSLNEFTLPSHLEQFDHGMIKQMIDKKINSVPASSMGRLFDAVSAIIGGKLYNTFEAEAAIHLMHAAVKVDDNSYYEYEYIDQTSGKIRIKELIKMVYNEYNKGKSYGYISAKFHNTIIKILTASVKYAASENKINKVVLSGGSFQNEILLEGVEKELEREGLQVYSHQSIPCNDGGISLGQVAVASKLLNENKTKVNYLGS